jgi:hypothetical protein
MTPHPLRTLAEATASGLRPHNNSVHVYKSFHYAFGPKLKLDRKKYRLCGFAADCVVRASPLSRLFLRTPIFS